MVKIEREVSPRCFIYHLCCSNQLGNVTSILEKIWEEFYTRTFTVLRIMFVHSVVHRRSIERRRYIAGAERVGDQPAKAGKKYNATCLADISAHNRQW